MKQPETRLRVKIRKYVKDIFGGFWIKIWGGPFQSAGIPDYICCIQGLFIGLEVKCEGKEASALQLDAIREINSCGGYAAVVYTEEEAFCVVAAALATSEGSRTFLVDEKGRLLLDGTRHWQDLHDAGVASATMLSGGYRKSPNYMPSKRRGRLAR